MSSYLASNGSVSHHQTFNIKSDKIIKKLLGLKIPEPELDAQASYLLCECAVCIKCI